MVCLFDFRSICYDFHAEYCWMAKVKGSSDDFVVYEMFFLFI